MRHTWRWFGPEDPVSLQDARQAGAKGIVTALHQFPAGVPWPGEAVRERQAQTRNAGLDWEVVESLPVSETIKTKGADYAAHIDAYKVSMQALAEAGISTICYNFMPVLDWTRTDLRWPLANGAQAMRFDLVMFAAFDCFILGRAGAEADYDDDTRRQAKDRFDAMSDSARTALAKSVTAGLPGAVDSWTLDQLKAGIAAYKDISPADMKRHHVDFLSEVAPSAERLGLRLCCHPDDPPFSLLGLPRVMSTGQDYADVLDAVDSPAVGMTLCTGSLGVHPGNDCVEIAKRFAERTFFLHLRSVTRDSDTVPCSFYEDEHLGGDVDLVGVIEVIVKEEARRRAAGRSDAEIFMRPDHGQDILTDIGAGLQPGYPAVGRLKGLAEIRGVETALKRGATA
jgi:mannonate dehydratase